MIGAIPKVDIRAFSAQVVGDSIIEKRIGRCHCVGIAAEQLDGLRGTAALPNANEPERVETAARQGGQFLVRDFVESADVTAVLFAQLRQPHVGALGDQDRTWHPRGASAEFFVLISRVAKNRYVGMADDRRPLLLSAFAAKACS